MKGGRGSAEKRYQLQRDVNEFECDFDINFVASLTSTSALILNPLASDGNLIIAKIFDRA